MVQVVHMDPISASASVVSFIALALQLAESVQRLHNFWLSVGNATNDVQEILDDLHLLGCILSQIAQDTPSGALGPEKPPSYFRVLQRCKENILKLEKIMNEFQLGLSYGGTRRRWMAFKVVAKKPQIEGFHLILERTKTTLMIELLRLHWFQNSENFVNLQKSISNMALVRAATVTDHVQVPHASLPITRTSRDPIIHDPEHTEDLTKKQECPSIKIVFPPLRGTVTRRKKVCYHFKTYIATVVLFYEISSTEDTSRSKFHQFSKGQTSWEWVAQILPLGVFGFIFKNGLDVSMSFKSSKSASSGFMSMEPGLRYYPVVPETAEIFEACKLGNVQWATSLFARGKASPFDTDPKGWTPLHVAAYHNNFNLCRLLIDLGAASNALTSLGAHPLALACIGDRFNHQILLDLVRLLVERGGADPTTQDYISDDCLYHIRRSPIVSRYLRIQNSISPETEITLDSRSALHWAIVDCSCPEKIRSLLQQGLDPLDWSVGFRSETGPILHAGVSLLNPPQTTPEGLDPAARDRRIKEIFVMVLKWGYDLFAVDDNLATAFDIVLEICRKWRYRQAILIWRSAIEEAGLNWEEYLAQEKALHAKRSRSDYLGARDYYWSLQMQRDYWLSYDWQDESRERLFWNPDKLDFDPLEDSGGTYAPSISELKEQRTSSESGKKELGLEHGTKRCLFTAFRFGFFACLGVWAALFALKYQVWDLKRGLPLGSADISVHDCHSLH